MNKIKLIVALLLISISTFAKSKNDTINVVINLQQVDSLGLRINLFPPSDLTGIVSYQFPRTIPGIYENLRSHKSLIQLQQNNKEIKCEHNSFSINLALDQNSFSYAAKSSVNLIIGVSAEDTYYLKDSIYLLNWHYLLGFFQDKTSRPYKIKVIKNAKLYGSGSLSKTILNDTIDIYTASNYKDLIHHPIAYSIPDTTNFQIGESNFHIACMGADTLMNSHKIKDLLMAPLTEILKHSRYKPKEYSFIYFSEYSMAIPGLRGLEHPNSTLVCYHSALLDYDLLIGSSIHEFIHAIYAPLRIRSEVIDDFHFTNPVCGKYLWLYEGTTEYLAIKTLLNSGVFTNEDFLNEINLSNEYHKNFNFSKISRKIYGKRGQKLFDNFYTTGSLFALKLDMEIMRKSNGKKTLFDVMLELQEKYTVDKPFNSELFNEEFAKISGVDISFLKRNVERRSKIDFKELVNDMGYDISKEKNANFSFRAKKTFIIKDYKNNRLRIAFIGSIINEDQNAKKITFLEINGQPITWFNIESLTRPSSDETLALLIKIGETKKIIKAKPKLTTFDTHHTVWTKNGNYEKDLVRTFWNVR